MKCRTVVNPEVEEEVVIYAHAESSLTRAISELVRSADTAVVGYIDGEIVRLNYGEVECFFVEDGHVLAAIGDKRYRVRERLYELETVLGQGFVKINQSCLVSVARISHFKATVGGALCVVMRCGYKDYVSRRQLKAVKERLGIK